MRNVLKFLVYVRLFTAVLLILCIYNMIIDYSCILIYNLGEHLLKSSNLLKCCNSFSFCLQREHKKSDLSIRAKQLISENENLEIELAEINLMTEKLERDAAEQREAAIKRQAEELASLKKSNQLIKVTTDIR